MTPLSRYHGVGSQVAFSGSNFILAATASITMDVQGLSHYALLSTVTMWLSTLMNAWISFPYAMTMPKTSSQRRRLYVETSLRSSGILFSLTFAAATSISIVFGDPVSTIANVVFVLVYLLRHEQRSAFLAEERPGLALRTELISLALTMIFASVVIFGSQRLSIPAFLAAAVGTTIPSLCLGYASGGLFRYSHRRAVRRHMASIWRGIGFEMTKGVALAELMNNAYVYALSAAGRHNELALVYSVNLLFRHVAVLSNGLSNAIRPGFVRRINQDQASLARKSASKLMGVLGVLVAATVAVILGVLYFWPEVFFHGKFAPHELTIVICLLALCHLLSAIRMPMFIFVQSRGQLRFLTVATGYAAIVGGMLQISGSFYAGIPFILFGLLVSNALFTGMVFTKYREG